MSTDTYKGRPFEWDRPGVGLYEDGSIRVITSRDADGNIGACHKATDEEVKFIMTLEAGIVTPTPEAQAEGSEILSDDQIIDLWAGASDSHDDTINIVQLARAIEVAVVRALAARSTAPEEPVAWAIFDSRGFYKAVDSDQEAEAFCARYNARPVDPCKPYTYAPLYTRPSPAVGAEPTAVTEWRRARAAAIAAVETYNTALKAARAQDELKGFGFTNVHAEFAAMTETSNLAHRLAGPALDALFAPSPQEPGPAAAVVREAMQALIDAPAEVFLDIEPLLIEQLRQHVRAAIKPAPPVLPPGMVSGWQPIETAPKSPSGQNVLLKNGNWVTVGHWHPNGFWCCNAPTYQAYGADEQPTEWMPIPATQPQPLKDAT